MKEMITIACYESWVIWQHERYTYEEIKEILEALDTPPASLTLFIMNETSLHDWRSTEKLSFFEKKKLHHYARKKNISQNVRGYFPQKNSTLFFEFPFFKGLENFLKTLDTSFQRINVRIFSCDLITYLLNRTHQTKEGHIIHLEIENDQGFDFVFEKGELYFCKTSHGREGLEKTKNYLLKHHKDTLFNDETLSVKDLAMNQNDLYALLLKQKKKYFFSMPLARLQKKFWETLSFYKYAVPLCFLLTGLCFAAAILKKQSLVSPPQKTVYRTRAISEAHQQREKIRLYLEELFTRNDTLEKEIPKLMAIHLKKVHKITGNYQKKSETHLTFQTEKDTNKMLKRHPFLSKNASLKTLQLKEGGTHAE